VTGSAVAGAIPPTTTMAKLTVLGRSFFAIAIAALGIQQLITGEFVRLVPGFPVWIPWPAVWARLSGVALIVAGTRPNTRV
jgi:uncharacterized membrane protein